MVYSFVYLCALLALSGINAAAITNGELYKILINHGNAKELTDDDINGGDVMTVDDDNLIYLPGDAEDEVDIGSLMGKLGLLNIDGGDSSANDNKLDGAKCSCSRDSCMCCIEKIFIVQVMSRTISVKITACEQVQYLPSDTSFLLTFGVNGHVFFHKVVSLLHPPRICANLAGRVVKAQVCLEIYNVNLQQKSLCTRLAGELDFTGKKVYFRLAFACFRIPLMNGNWLAGPQQNQELSAAEAVTPDDDTIITTK